ncbi:MAG: hypothetical protein CL433_07190 [Acidimicrobiaceae bacterium]|jgi:hypothetical protein|nr:hypothetical protein [Acidimicrobiaceae bacterium]HAB58550.1 hypothetical protein [Acidimicrobiaceae bacterium]
MPGSLLRLTALGALASLIVGLVRSARRQPTPTTTGVASWEPLVEEASTPSRSGPVQFVDTGTSTEHPGWVEPDADGGCPGSHPVKGNTQSKIFHVPGGVSYGRINAERCYCDEATAEADGYRKAKR